jgi:hypothetical protein
MRRASVWFGFSLIAGPLLLGLMVTPACAETRIEIPAVQESKLEFVVPVIAPQARCAALNDRLGWLAFGHRLQRTDAQVSLFRLDGEGKPVDTPVLLALPRPEGLTAHPGYVTSLAFHPKLPLLYVWQEVDLPKNEQRFPLPLSPTQLAGINQFDHLLIYKLEGERPELLVGLCRGTKFGYSRPSGGISVDPAGERLYVPNLADPKAPGRCVIGSYVLDADGLPVFGEEGKGTITDRVAAIKAAHAAGTPVLPQRVAPFNMEAFLVDVPLGSGFGYVHIARDFVLCGGAHTTAIITWQPENRRERLHSFLVSNPYRNYTIAGHPRLPVIIVSDPGTPWAYRFEHVDGYLTMLPQKATFAGTNLTSGPVILSKANKVAFGAQGMVITVTLDEQGRVTTERAQMKLSTPTLEALVFSDRFDRLYVAVEKNP